MAGVRAAAFDLDGLMFNTEALFFDRVLVEVLAARGKELTPEIVDAVIGRREPAATAALKAAAGLDDPVDILLAETGARLDALLEDHARTAPGLALLLDRLGVRGVPLALATSSSRAYAERLLRAHGLLDRFGVVLTSEDVVHGKPDPEIYLTAAARLGVPAADMVVFEDSPAGVAAGKAAGSFVVAVPHRHSPAEGLGAADVVVPRLDHASLLGIFG